MVKRLALMSVSCLTGCHFSPAKQPESNTAAKSALENTSDKNDAQPVVVDNTTVEAFDPWSLSDHKDPITDRRVLTAETKAIAGVNDLEVLLTCEAETGNLKYKFSGFDKNGQGARIPSRDSGFYNHMINSVLFRVDTQPARTVSTIDPQYSNQTMIQYDDAVRAASAQNLTLRIQFSDAEETYSLDQTTSNFRNVVQPCMEARQNSRRQNVGSATQQTSPSQPAMSNGDEVDD